MSLLAACVEPNPQSFYFATASGSGPSVLSSPTLIVSSDAQNAAALRFTCDGNGNTSIAPNGSTSTSTMTLGGSTTNNATLVINQNSGTGQGFIQVGNPNGGTSVNIVGSTAPNGNGSIQCSGTSSLTLGANNVNFDNLVLNSNGTTTISDPIIPGYSVTKSATIAIGPGQTYEFPIPSSPGLYSVMAQTATSNAVSDNLAHLASTYYFNGTAIVCGGFAVSAPVGGTSGLFSMLPYSSGGAGTAFNRIQYSNSNPGGGAAVSITLNFVQLMGVVPGM
jgi:hypothetical protein